MTDAEREDIFKRTLADSIGIVRKIARTFAPRAEDQDDLFQAILLQMWASLPEFRGDAKATTWVYRVALNTALNWRRENRKHRELRDCATDAAHVPDRTVSHSDEAANREMLAWLQRQLGLLGPAERALMLLHLEGQSYREIAEVLGISESNVGAKLSRLRQRFATAARSEFDGL